MLKTIGKLLALLDPGDRWKVVILMALMIITAFAQTAGVVSVMPFLAVLSNPEMIHENQWLATWYRLLGFDSERTFLYFLGVVAFIIFMVGTALQAVTYWVITRFSFTQQYHLSRRLMADYLRRPYTFFLNRNSSDLAKTVLQETSVAVTGALLPAMRLLSSILLAATVVAMLIFINPWLTISVSAGIGLFYGVVYAATRTWLKRIGSERIAANRERFMAAAEAFAGAKEIRLLGREREYLERYRESSRRVTNYQSSVALLTDLPLYVIEAITFGGVLLIVIYLMRDGFAISDALPTLGVYALAGKQLIPAFQKIFGAVSAIRFNMPVVEHVLADMEKVVPSDSWRTSCQVTDLIYPRDGIVISDLSFRYPGSEKFALENLQLTIPARSTIGFVGASGAGKSTLIDLILGLLEPDAGEIRIDNTPLNSSNVRRWQAALGYVPQHIFLADQSVAANIALGVVPKEIDMAAVETAARLANLHAFVTQELPSGYATIIGERGVRLSGGQRQRIGIARALYRDPPVLVFDEATSALDNNTESAVMEAIHNLAGDKTILLVAHRLTTVKPCNTIYVLAGGKVVEDGSWEDLAQSGVYFQRLAAGSIT
ncbi:ABC transporter ATP-binding protein [Thiorhodococcus mannitoliphagus]|uniref:ABC transporter ATP-binding protein n=1 Tax=Thiorhodococcus mannitoliphagus TaxID=329406 RepID=A0A6P1E282_9GAMM|nr:ABC transporter ATP-binding protein [Thiorhodococcus mannitoliphagus]NEX22622.1 ABC transporter ATP-binding protein [Thiorhodococcus mannitoliphagus]